MAAVVTNAGRAIATNRIKNGATGATEPNFLGWGTGAGTAVVVNTALNVASAEARVAGTSSQQLTTVANDTYRVVGTITSASAQSITNVMLFDASTGGNGFVHADFAAIPLAINDSIQFTVNAVLG